MPAEHVKACSEQGERGIELVKNPGRQAGRELKPLTYNKEQAPTEKVGNATARMCEQTSVWEAVRQAGGKRQGGR